MLGFFEVDLNGGYDVVLIIGGAYQGKKAFTCEQFQLKEQELVDGRTSPYGSLTVSKGMHHLQDYIKRFLLDELDATEQILSEIDANPEVYLLCNELGCGLVPIDAFDRRYRETVGRLQCELAKRAKEIYRVYCGIGVKIK